jgi:hypothetical protein
MGKPVTLPPGRAKLSTKPCATGSVTIANTTGMVLVSRRSAITDGVASARITSGRKATSSDAAVRNRSAINACCPAIVEADVVALSPTKLLESGSKRLEQRLKFRVAFRSRHQHADAPHPPVLLRPHRARPKQRGRRCAAEEGEEVAARDHSMTSSARTSTVAGTSRPSALAVFMLMTKLNFVGCMMGRSAGFSPLRTGQRRCRIGAPYRRCCLDS